MKKIQNYCEQHTTPLDELRNELIRETHLKTLAPQMLSGPFQGKLLEFISWMIQPKYILEIGTFTGFSALCFAPGLQEGGKLITLESNYELEKLIRKYVDKSGYSDRIDLRIGDAKEIIGQLDYLFDLVFIDAGKAEYPIYYDLVLPKVRKGGFILMDNVLWDGKVFLEKKDEETQALYDLAKTVANDERVENIMLPIRDGLLLTRKR